MIGVLCAAIPVALVVFVTWYCVWMYKDVQKYNRKREELDKRFQEDLESAYSTESMNADMRSHLNWHRRIATMPQDEFEAIIEELTPAAEEGTHP